MPDYQHHWKDGTPVNLPLGKIVCIGRNYAEHARELNNPVPDEPLLFIKPATSAVHITRPLDFPRNQGAVHFETELAVLIGRPLTNASASDAEAAILGYGLALDLTLRDVQSRLKEKGQPWERAKAFDGACPLSPFVCIDRLRRDHLTFTLDINRERQQTGDTRDMLNPIVPLIAHMSTQFTLMPGDVVLTGTPKGVGPLESGQILSLELEDALFVETTVL
ncbi:MULTISPECIES: fumarylacetoacetate hydrolase family protein [Marinobacter]|jgi:2-keto-4-pentenoate hydratase/2-oxohepta-3-ene-1,7-dioic acid hydratase in catechol pathway|uniref:fumarylacetoacetate hydrolase family protein n=1 Tax=Marinobacter TaxID=2742 RepID=UPI000F8570D4|nr:MULTISPECIES: fumarylacetoacetate hydrolase family protein [Marinobacter]AZR42220.1 5-carboxymethyl-2-hydroxymuconate Delta-isomerase [Marinobacter salarius]MBJ7275538.1 fumarylacetoacetate hydrolase family protein [Marinobacter salarius]MBJ7299174.1 fumarylacetoacetate hydrolase family protein [Marinobacter salarius]MBS8230042.1 fumarylacetoacetate hydrolase family protein [Marinobacter salarius]MDP4531915.1 fumarylacetoacetate hydrolase family protein [Marinobacter salarius]|tara:strand:- start:2553 stop:3215 length:663 start_codon:yes stop_codon:yes gene_type:complete